MSTFTPEQLADARFYADKSLTITNRMRAVERIRKPAESQIIERVDAADYERFMRGREYHHNGAYRSMDRI